MSKDFIRSPSPVRGFWKSRRAACQALGPPLRPPLRPSGTACCFKVFSKSPADSGDRGKNPLTKTRFVYIDSLCHRGFENILVNLHVSVGFHSREIWKLPRIFSNSLRRRKFIGSIYRFKFSEKKQNFYNNYFRFYSLFSLSLPLSVPITSKRLCSRISLP